MIWVFRDSMNLHHTERNGEPEERELCVPACGGGAVHGVQGQRPEMIAADFFGCLVHIHATAHIHGSMLGFIPGGLHSNRFKPHREVVTLNEPANKKILTTHIINHTSHASLTHTHSSHNTTQRRSGRRSCNHIQNHPSGACVGPQGAVT